MKISKIFFTFSFLSLFLHADINKDIYNGFSLYKGFGKQEKVLKSVIYRAISEFEKKNDIKFYTTFFNSEKQELEEFSSYKKINVLTTYSTTYLKNSDFFKKNAKEIYFLGQGGDFSQYYLIANKDSNIKNMKDLRNKTYISVNGNDTYSMWLDYLTLKNLKRPYRKVIKSERNAFKDKTVILDLYFKKSDFAILPKNVYEDMILLNPALKKELRIVKKSKPIFMFAMIFIHKKTPTELVEIIRNTNQKLEHLLKFVDRDTIKRIEFKDLKSFEKFYEDYLQLKAKYKK